MLIFCCSPFDLGRLSQFLLFIHSGIKWRPSFSRSEANDLLVRSFIPKNKRPNISDGVSFRRFRMMLRFSVLFLKTIEEKRLKKQLKSISWFYAHLHSCISCFCTHQGIFLFSGVTSNAKKYFMLLHIKEYSYSLVWCCRD